MLMSHLQDSVAHADAVTQITYNRYEIEFFHRMSHPVLGWTDF